ncbi:hypothetical protein [Methylophaga nitratireducenticrescens]|uniref:Uncharacterized protein n=1 Tax=Methylophaga nitratireducenticrescens TaxID=754476 RepID=I1XMP6_METNJ|nr:hypothetical protein [Methylophaga nitratireducenticrescens]AFI85665.1 hypothetical protein Q7A_2887 [Methylophaga nitratireducenticrescens]AUZ85395.1 hypothetical protein CDW43_12835 [Methylophaga nitratireducenticrescens]
MNKIKLSKILSLSLSITAVGSIHAADIIDLTGGDPFFYTFDQMVTEDNKQKSLLGVGRPDKTHSQIPHLPVYYGYMSTNSTYRFVNVVEQVFTMIGEGKHGLWRIQENGTVRFYLKRDGQGLDKAADILAVENQQHIEDNYSYYLPEESWSGYKYPDQKFNEEGKLNFVDLPINHPIFDQQYADHEPIDLANYYCTMSGNDYPYAKMALDFAFSQPGANQIGPLGKRAGLDVKENYAKVLRLNHLPDARSWVNVGQPGKDALHVNWQAVDADKTKGEFYLVERTFFNKPYIFLTAVYDNPDNTDHQYIRPAGPYFESLGGKGAELKSTVTKTPRFHLENGDIGQAIGLPLYGVHHPDRASYDSGGACPLKGGDWGRYPDTSGGSSWPTTYEEVTPLCDALLVDIKFYSNLDGRDWTDPNKYLANAGMGTETVTYKMQPGHYGVFTDPYNTSRGIKNSESQDLPAEITVTYPTAEPPVSFVKPAVSEVVQGMVPGEFSTCRPVIQASLVDEVNVK